jgi:hypothetical protein
VTGGSGFVATHCLLQLLEAGYRVKTTPLTLAPGSGIGVFAKPHEQVCFPGVMGVSPGGHLSASVST